MIEIGTRIRVKDDPELEGVVVLNTMLEEYVQPDEVCVLLDRHAGGLIYLERELEVIE